MKKNEFDIMLYSGIDLLKSYDAGKDINNEIIKTCEPFIKSRALRLKPWSMELDDAVNIGRLQCYKCLIRLKSYRINQTADYDHRFRYFLKTISTAMDHSFANEAKAKKRKKRDGITLSLNAAADEDGSEFIDIVQPGGTEKINIMFLAGDVVKKTLGEFSIDHQKIIIRYLNTNESKAAVARYFSIHRSWAGKIINQFFKKIELNSIKLGYRKEEIE
ncbi:hypothetical protein OYT88_06210 [Sporolactobacillus sp. CQH2019]|uniref:hypothetical protein n=1 Tax=Sporolactobacillus sp. CQH2019 TaxID=3023512 RepID=UPI0023682513|nr:hypothetical protein [Sporolactobacillus sp. CQH2019]MDD9148140.1 hypothetical protein [Sporolactobacillus sp. CQH2019]